MYLHVYRRTSSGYQGLLDTQGQGASSFSVPSNSVPGRSNVPAFVVQGRRSSDSTNVYRSTMVHQSVTQVQGTHEDAGVTHSFTRYIEGHSGSQQSFTLPASRVETLKLGLSRKGYSDSTIEFIIGAVSPSTRNQYQSIRKNFLI